MAINLVTKFSPKVAERFKQASLTEGAFNHDYEFTGIKTLKIFSIDTVPIGDYTRSGTSRYGAPTELGDTIQELTMTQDKAFTFTIDKGNAGEQINIKSATKALRRETDERIIPMIDKYRFNVWTRKAGLITGLTAAPTKDTIVSLIMDATEALDDAFVTASGRRLYIPTKYYKLLKQNPDFLGNDVLGKKVLEKGEVGEVDGMQVFKVPATYLPDGVYFLITNKKSILGPKKLEEYKVHKDPPGISGDLAEGRVIHDAFVLGAKANGIYAAVDKTLVTATPTASASGGNVTLTCAGATIRYTVDGTDPRYSDTAAVYTAPVAATAVKAYAEVDGKFASAVLTYGA